MEESCPICFENFAADPPYLRPLIYCKNGHSFCERCCGQLQTCATCRGARLADLVPNRSLLQAIEEKWARPEEHAAPTIEFSELRKEAEPFATGGYADVYLAKWRGVDVALKQLRLQANGADARSLQTEIRLASQLSHPNVIRTFGAVALPNGAEAIAMEYATSGALTARLLALAPAQAASIGTNIVDGLDYVHSRHIAHRDLSPNNVLLFGDRLVAKLCDFGASKVLKTLTKNTAQVGTPKYAAPELMEPGRQVRGGAADIYSLSIILYEMFSQTEAYDDCASILQIMMAVAGNRRPAIGPGFPSGVAECVKKGWGADPEGRGCLAEFRHALSTVPAAPAGPRASSASMASRLTALSATSEEYLWCRQEVDKAFDPVHGRRVCAHLIQKVENQHHADRFRDYSKHGIAGRSRTARLFHGTHYYEDIAENGFMMPELKDGAGRYVSVAGSGGVPLMFGSALYFAPAATKGAAFGGPGGALLLCEVELGKTVLLDEADPTLDAESVRRRHGADSVFCEGRTKTAGGVASPEYAVYHPAQVQVLYVIHYQTVGFRTVDSAMYQVHVAPADAADDAAGPGPQQAASSVVSEFLEAEGPLRGALRAPIPTLDAQQSLQRLGTCCRDHPRDASLKSEPLWDFLGGLLASSGSEVIQWHVLRCAACYAHGPGAANAAVGRLFPAALRLLGSWNEAVVQRASFFICNLTMKRQYTGDGGDSYVAALKAALSRVGEALSKLYVICSINNAMRFGLLSEDETAATLDYLLPIACKVAWNFEDWTVWTLSVLLNTAGRHKPLLAENSRLKLVTAFNNNVNMAAFSAMTAGTHDLAFRWFTWSGCLSHAETVSSQVAEQLIEFALKRAAIDDFAFAQVVKFHASFRAVLHRNHALTAAFHQKFARSDAVAARAMYAKAVLDCSDAVQASSGVSKEVLREWANAEYKSQKDKPDIAIKLSDK